MTLTDHDIYLFKEGNHFRLYDDLGAHIDAVDGKKGARFAVWAPNAERVSVVGDFNGWDPNANPMGLRWDGSGIWEGFVPGFQHGAVYKYHIVSRMGGYTFDKGDPLAFSWEAPPKTASRLWDLSYEWGDSEWMDGRARRNALDGPMSIYEVHLGSWRRVPHENDRCLTYREMAGELADYLEDMHFSHAELMPVMEHPFYGSWGYQTTGFFAPTARFGTPQDLMFLVDRLHRKGKGVIFDWVPAHFPDNQHGLVYFDGTHLYEHADTRQGFHPDWKSDIFNLGRHEVRSFLFSSAAFWLDKYHADGLRVDGVASMLYLDYSRKSGEWVPNEYGGRENLEAIAFLRKLNEMLYKEFPGIQMVAEESTAWPMVSRPVHLGGLGFGMKWNMGWMHDTLGYFGNDPLFRKYRHDMLTFSILYQYAENFILPLSHDEVVHGKGSLFGRMPGDRWRKFANLRLLLGYMYAHPGKKLLFMGGEFGQEAEWDHGRSLDWHVLADPAHRGVQNWVRDLNRFNASEPAMHERDFSSDGFEWLDFRDWEQSVVSFFRKGRRPEERVLAVCNFTPVPRHGYRIGVPSGGAWREALNSDASEYGGSGMGNLGRVEAEHGHSHGRPHSLSVTLPPLAIVLFKPEGPR
jgi:1,4-alpha-glucan branching enzyme